jgi:CubicO group peptidase (beta-lactamase class C family)
VKLNETPCETAEANGSTVAVSMDTGVRLEGEVQLNRGRIRGDLVYPDGTRNSVELLTGSREDYPLLKARVGAEGPYAYRVPSEGDDGWITAPAHQEGIPSGALEELVAAVDRGELGVLHSLLVARSGHLILEEYFHGFEAGDVHHLASCTKSVSSLLAGLAIQEGAISGVEARLLDFFPQDRDAAGAGWEELTLEHLLTMSMALDWSADEVQNLHGTGPEFFRRVLSRSVAGTPGEDFEYASANVNLLAGILHETTGSHAEAFAQRTLFEPLGIESWDWSGMRTDGYNLMDGSLRILPRDMAKLGQMALDGGRWQGRPVVAEEWIRQSTSTQIQAGSGAEGYGYLWWTREAPGPGGTMVPAFFANGWGSQFILVFPTLELVVVTTGGNEYNGKHMRAAEGIVRYLLPEVLSR